MSFIDRLRNRAASALLGDEIGKLRQAQAIWLDAYQRGPGVTSPQQLERSLKELDSQMLNLILNQYGWERIGATQDVLGLTESDRLRAVETARYMTHYDTQSKNALDTWTDFGFGQRVEVHPRDNPPAVEVWDEFSSAQRNAPLLKQRRLHWLSNEVITAGELFFVFWTNKVTGTHWPTTTFRRIGSEEIGEIKSVPEDPDVPLWYVQNVSGFQVGGQSYSQVWYPDWQATDEQLDLIELPAGVIDARELRDGTDCVMLHAALNSLNGRGWPQFAQAYQWFRAYTDSLGDVMAKNRAVAMFVDKLKVKGGSRTVDAIAARLTSTLSSSVGGTETNPSPVPGSTWIENEAADRTRLPLTTGASDDRITTGLVLGQGYAGTGVPLGLVRSDFFQNRSVAEIVMEPWYETCERYQNWWSDVFTDICHCVLMKAGIEDAQDVVVDVTLENPVRTTTGEVAAIIDAVTKAAQGGTLDGGVAKKVAVAVLGLALARVGLRNAVELTGGDAQVPEEPAAPALPEQPGGELPEPDGAEEPEPAGPEIPEEPTASEALRLALRNLLSGAASTEDVVRMALAEMAEGG